MPYQTQAYAQPTAYVMPTVYQPQQQMAQAPQPQPQIFQPQQYQYMQAPPPPVSFPQPPPAAQPVIPNVPPPNFVPNAQTSMAGGQAYAQQGASASMPQPVVPNIAQNNGAPVIPQMLQQQAAMHMPEPMVDPDPPRSRSRLGPGQYGPYDDRRRRTPSPHYRSRSLSQNPLPRPPRDIFDSTPYIRLLDELRRPIDNDTLKRNLTVKTMQTQAVNMPMMGPAFPSGSGSRRHERKHRKGLFNVFGRRNRNEDDEDIVSPMQAQPMFYPTMPAQQPYAAPQMTQVDPGVGAPPAMMYAPSREPTPIPMREPTPVPRVTVNRQNEFASLIPSSPVRVHYHHKSYPTAFHLHEALKFMEHMPEIAERIRTCRTVNEAREISITNDDYVRNDWEHVLYDMMDEVIYQKLLQHEHLRALLLETGLADIVFSDTDEFWGEGPVGRGLNELGRSLMRVRDRFREEGLT
ncbi:uncharacterized protein C8Q71DRAFT_725553 [Rhodofomes roseus]|uniref:NADAR domain-containing protein n=1 Tax=Rhodofomes roseus TaxID=34475 RepID=A0ABQ8K9K9_9APHY|nr:uncharacterized protein C8Q71DRAFT_725553 [Rhodofomes roseus]KAH9833802.1 hypothetical protein C8Q71DRAFT_725553 [Rhodofomes roseus]